MAQHLSISSSQQVEIAVQDHGGSGRPLVIAHAAGFHGMAYQPLATLMSRFYRCVSFDFRGHGQSTLPVGASLDWHRMTDDLLAVVDYVSPDAPVLAFGHSLGGGCIALGSSSFPDRFQMAWSFEPILAPRKPKPATVPIADRARRRRFEFSDREEALTAFSSASTLGAIDSRALQMYVEYGLKDSTALGVELCCQPETEAAVLENAYSGSMEAALTGIVPHCVAVGSDGGIPAHVARAVASVGKNLTLVEMDLTHYGPLENPESVASEMVDWFMSERDLQ